jgi:hypothetical protein
MTTPAGAVAGNAAQAQREEARRPQGSGLFSRKYGPLPGWAWATLAAGGALAWFWWRNRQSSQASDTSDTTDEADLGTSQADSDQLASLQDEIAALQGAVATQQTTGAGSTTGTTTPTGSTTPAGNTKWVTANGKQDIYQISKANGLTESKFLNLNKTQKNLQKYVGTGKPLPKGWRVRVS